MLELLFYNLPTAASGQLSVIISHLRLSSDTKFKNRVMFEQMQRKFMQNPLHEDLTLAYHQNYKHYLI